MAWNRNAENAAQPTPKKKPTAWRGAVAGIVAVAVAAVVAFLVLSGGDAKPKAKEEKKPAAIKEVKPDTVASATAMEEQSSGPEEPKPLMWLGKKVTKFSAETNTASGIIVESYVTEDGKLHKHLIEPRKEVFDNVADQMIAMAITTPKGEIMPPMPLYPGFEREFEEALKKPIEFKDDDTPEVRALKERVAATREDVKRMMAEGQTIREILTEHEKVWNENIDIHNKAQAELNEIVRSGDAEGARKYEIRMNAALQQMGVREIHIPDYTKTKKEIMAERAERGNNE